MIYSARKNFLFIHIPKTGGMTVRKLLEQYNEAKLTNVRYAQQVKAKAFSKHMRAEQARKLLAPAVYDNCFSFAFVRNPWAWLVSGYHYVRKDTRDPRYELAHKMSFKEFTIWLLNAKQYEHVRYGQSYFLQENGKFIVSFIGRTEQLNQGMEFICNKIQVPFHKAPVVNKTDHKHYRTYYDNELRDIVQKTFTYDIETFNYGF